MAVMQNTKRRKQKYVVYCKNVTRLSCTSNKNKMDHQRKLEPFIMQLG